MTPERFHAIVDAYGADSRRWPAAEREAALAWSRQHGPADTTLADAEMLDALLACDAPPSPTPKLARRIIAAAPGPRLFERRGGLWWSGLVFASVSLVGSLAGALAVSFLLTATSPPALHEQPYVTTTFGNWVIDGETE